MLLFFLLVGTLLAASNPGDGTGRHGRDHRRYKFFPIPLHLLCCCSSLWRMIMMIFVTSLETYYYYSGSNAGSQSELNLSRRHSLESSHQRHSSASGDQILVRSVLFWYVLWRAPLSHSRVRLHARKTSTWPAERVARGGRNDHLEEPTVALNVVIIKREPQTFTYNNNRDRVCGTTSQSVWRKEQHYQSSVHSTHVNPSQLIHSVHSTPITLADVQSLPHTML